MMGEGYEEEEKFAENLREKLAVAVRDIEWSYAIFWSFSSSQPGVVEWGDGYYNGDIKTRKTVQATEEMSVDDVLGLQRTQQLRELYESLLAGEANPQSKMHSSVALSPEDLTDTEWYFLVCMSFMFNLGQGLPGRALAKNQSIWLCNAHQADSRIFSRSLLAKSASIQTVVCFPHLGGAIELGATDLVSEDLNLIQHIRTSYLDNGNSIVVSKLPNSFPGNGINYDAGGIELDFPPLDLECDGDNNEIGSPHKHSNDSFMAEEIHAAEASQLQRWRFADEDIIIGNCIRNNSGNSSDCISQNYVNWDYSELQPQGIDVHYQSVVSNVLQNSHQLILGPNFSRSGGGCPSSFVTWKKGVSSQSRTGATPQRVLKKVLMDVGRMHRCCSRESQKEDVTCRAPEGEETDRSRVLSERRRREKLNDRFMILASLIPTSGKVDKISILDETIEYLKDLERRVREVESHKETFELEARTRGESCDNDEDDDDNVERPSDSCGANEGTNKCKKSLPRKRKKVGDMGENSHGNYKGPAKRGVKVDMVDENISIEMRCFWSDGKLTKIIEALDHLHLVCHSIQSSNNDGILCVTINAKMEESKATSTALIRQSLQRLT